MKFTRIALGCAFALMSAAALAQSVIRPVPIPDMSKLPKAESDQLVETRAVFDRTKPNLVGAPLAEAYALLASSYTQAGLYDVADIALGNATVVVPDDARWIYLRGLLARMRNQLPQARQYFEEALRLDRKYLPMRVAVIEARLAAGDVDGAAQAANQAGVEGRDSAMIASLRARVAMRQQRYPEALGAVSDALRLEPAANQLYALQADIFSAQGNAAAATAARAKAGNTPVRILDTLGAGFLGASSIDLSAAAAPAAAPAAADKDDPINQARFLIAVQQFAAARTPLEQALKREPNNAGLLSLSARIEAMLGASATAKARASEAVRLSPNDAAALVSRGVVAETGGDEAAAQADYEKAIALDAKLVEARLLLGNRLMRQNRYAPAAEQYRQLIKLQPQQADNYARLAAAQVADGRCLEALKEVEAGLQSVKEQRGFVMQVYVRLVATCRGITPEQRKTGIDYARELYRARNTPAVIEAAALIEAFGGNFTVAEEVQSSAMFAAVRDGGTEAAAPFQEFYKRFQAKQMPDRPWPSNDGYFKPARLQPLPPERAAPTAKPAK
ncbi:cytochrome c-type biogenesis protein CcmH/NrfG [Tahibacter aquaticus]|uniref:Cytochrome c-type biogenesis protein CcmH/NrfG n=1 Tax=Tahibacter aquaticus TaxID=520092 RepID=A0A4R6YV58_9GAMM|nr:tetratricopeptide repeat protein [Tahibacter aquaticus]TDR42510.1 cytochrome c-type biogenesis protein CcmH/NrfG [Tahibacter aquaticus]